MNWTERELDLFKSKRQRGTKPKPAKEFNLHCLIGDLLQRWCSPEWRYTHIPLGEYRPPATAARLKRMGVMPGWPDFQFFHSSGRVCFLELKRRGDRASDAQEELAFFLMRARHGYLLTHDFNDALGWLKDLGIVPAQVTTIGANVDTRDTPWPPTQESSIE